MKDGESDSATASDSDGDSDSVSPYLSICVVWGGRHEAVLYV